MSDAEKKVNYFTIEVVYLWTRDNENALRKKKIINQTSAELKRMREVLVLEGLAVEVNTGHWAMIFPFDIKMVDIFLQRRWIE